MRLKYNFYFVNIGMFHQRVGKVSEDYEQASMVVVFALNDRVCLIGILHQTNSPTDSAQMISYSISIFQKKFKNSSFLNNLIYTTIGNSKFQLIL